MLSDVQMEADDSLWQTLKGTAEKEKKINFSILLYKLVIY